MGYKNLSASRGDGNYGHATHAGYSMSCIRTYLPREGTETPSFSGIIPVLLLKYKNLSTSRGDGNFLSNFKELRILSYKNLSASVGDGNSSTHRGYKTNHTGIRTYLPREGTETFRCRCIWLSPLFSIRTYLPREGTDTRNRIRFSFVGMAV